MNKRQAIHERDALRPQLIGQPFNNGGGWDIKDVIVGTQKDVADIYAKMYDNDLTNEAALLFFVPKDEDFDVFIISHQWPWGSGDLVYQTVEGYRKDKAF